MPPKYRQLLASLRAKFPNYAAAWERARNEFGEQWEQEFSAAITTMFGDDPAQWQSAVDGYAEFATDALRSQIFFERRGQYKATSYAEVSKLCYHNSEFMFRSYLPGMFLSHYVWPHHHRMLRWFRSLANDLSPSNFAEVGTGCGMYSKEPLSLFNQVRGVGYDISAHALKFTENVVRAFGYADRYTTELRDIIASPPPHSDLVICQEVLEHLEDPRLFVRALFSMTKPGGYAYITAAINAGHVDHIYLYRSLIDVRAHVKDAGFEILSERAEWAYEGKPVEITPCLGGVFARRPL